MRVIHLAEMPWLEVLEIRSIMIPMDRWEEGVSRVCMTGRDTT